MDVDITLTLSYIGGIRQELPVEYLREEKAKNKTLQMLTNNCGLHSLTFDNTYSWMTSKNVVFRVNVLKPEEDANSYFNLLVYPDEHTRLDREAAGIEVEESE